MVRRLKFLYVVWIFSSFILSGCGGVISEQIRSQVDPNVTFQDVLKNPMAYRGKTVIFSGTILETLNNKEGTLFTILQRPVGYNGRPLVEDQSGGRFLAQDSRYLAPAIYAPGRSLTVAGEVIGQREMPVGEISYRYPVLAVKELHLWKPQPDVHFGFGYYGQFFRYAPYYDPFYDPWGWQDRPANHHDNIFILIYFSTQEVGSGRRVFDWRQFRLDKKGRAF